MRYQTSIGRQVELTPERRKHILQFHPDLKPYLDQIKLVLESPEIIKRSLDDPRVLIFYRYFDTILSGKYIAVVVKTNQRNFILTSYLTSHIKTGEIYD